MSPRQRRVGIEEEDQLDLETLEGIGPTTKQKLMSAGVYSVIDLLVYSPTYLAEVLGTSVDRVIKLQEAARKKLQQLGLIEEEFITADKIHERSKAVSYITTGSKHLDNLLMGGIETRAITEFYGEFGTGKTQICHTLAVNVQLPKEMGGLSAPAIYIDTEMTFKPERIIQIASAKGLDPHEALRNIVVARARGASHLMLLVKELPRKLRETGARIVLIDSAVAPFRAEYIGRGQLAERQQLLNVMMHDLIRIAELYDVAVVITNQVQAAPDVIYGDPTRPIGGHVVAHAVTYRIYLRKAKGNTRIASMVDSPKHPPGEAIFVITPEGIKDPS
ncbi:DNA repair and recombination protein RadA [Candidatus Geothermarchaeota archaeon ex4572_27]|nr:MAG: DNA repair and recombination protein RadA [Candidatus Geothermarchaeota archaeon ex4572_27]